MSIVGWIKSFTSEDNPDCPDEDQHQDENAEIGDKRIQVVPLGEIFGYDVDRINGMFTIERQVYKWTATYSNGNKAYGWRSDRPLFRGTPEEWRSIKDNPEDKFEDIPANWDEIVDHTEQFLEIHEGQLDSPEYPHSTMKI